MVRLVKLTHKIRIFYFRKPFYALLNNRIINFTSLWRWKTRKWDGAMALYFRQRNFPCNQNYFNLFPNLFHVKHLRLLATTFQFLRKSDLCVIHGFLSPVVLSLIIGHIFWNANSSARINLHYFSGYKGLYVR